MEAGEHWNRGAPDRCIGMLCKKCIAAISSIRDSKPGLFQGPEPRFFAYAERQDTWRGAHHTQDGAFRAAVDDQCYVCYTLQQACPIEARHHAGSFRTFYEICPEVRDRYSLQITIEIRQDSLVTSTSSPVYEPYGKFRIIPKKVLPKFRGHLGLTPNTFSGECQKQIRKWLRECANDHPACKEDWRTTINYPIRLLHVRGKSDKHISLREFDNGARGIQYVTMSHCWNHGPKAHPLTLKEENLQQLKDGFLVSDLPKKFRDAVEIARWMEIDYLWIDALCIVQDSREDWQKQSRFMGDIYGGSYCNIAATNADADKGCFTDRPVEIVEPYLVQNPKKSSASSMETHVIGFDDFWCNSLLDSALHTRAWVLQERLLSPRTIHFGKEQMFWECRSHKACEAYPIGLPSEFCNRRTHAWRQGERLLSSSSKTVLQSGQTQESIAARALRYIGLGHPTRVELLGQIYHFWSTTVERYMECNLSFSSDKLVAIAGIAKQVEQLTGEPYLAGLWDNDCLPQSLLWYVPVRRQANEEPSFRYPSLGRAEYRAPSWSWASLDARIVWHWPTRCDQLLIRIEHTTIEMAEDGGSAIKFAGMRIQGRLVAVQLQIMHRNENGSLKEDGSYALVPRETQFMATSSEVTCEERSHVEPIVYLDTTLSPAPNMDVYLLPVCTQWRDRNGYVNAAIAGLILKKGTLAKRVVYERMGVFGLDESQANIVESVRGPKGDLQADLASVESFMLI